MKATRFYNTAIRQIIKKKPYVHNSIQSRRCETNWEFLIELWYSSYLKLKDSTRLSNISSVRSGKMQNQDKIINKKIA